MCMYLYLSLCKNLVKIGMPETSTAIYCCNSKLKFLLQGRTCLRSAHWRPRGLFYFFMVCASPFRVIYDLFCGNSGISLIFIFKRSTCWFPQLSQKYFWNFHRFHVIHDLICGNGGGSKGTLWYWINVQHFY